MLVTAPPNLQREFCPLQLQTPLTQTLRFCLAQSFPQPPQFATSAVTFVSHPLSPPVAGFVQLPRPGKHEDVHAPAAHATLATPLLEHERLHSPQLATSALIGRSQPGAPALVSQSPNPELQAP
jgi:hypothetical protein